jgi:Fe-S-cluster containining protein
MGEITTNGLQAPTADDLKTYDDYYDRMPPDVRVEFDGIVKSILDELEENYKENGIEGFEGFLESFDELVQSAKNVTVGASCRKGCSHCCYQQPTTSVLEAMHIVTYLKNKGKPLDLDPVWNWEKGKVPCIFLENGECSIYEARPVMCRKYYVHTPKENCDSFNNPGTPVGIALNGYLEAAFLGVMATNVTLFNKKDTNLQMALLMAMSILAKERHTALQTNHHTLSNKQALD